MLEWILTIAMVLSMLPTAAVAQVEKPETMIYGRQKLPDLEPGYLINPLHDEGAGPPDWFCSQFYPPLPLYLWRIPMNTVIWRMRLPSCVRA